MSIKVVICDTLAALVAAKADLKPPPSTLWFCIKLRARKGKLEI